MASGSTREGLLRQEVGELRRRESRRVFDPVLYVGALGGPRDRFVVRTRDLPVMDVALRTEVVSSLLEDCDETGTAWVTRPGEPELHDGDLAWLAAADRAFAMHGRSLEWFYALTRYGWLDVRSGRSRAWRRLRL